jgi:hypothetical protein
VSTPAANARAYLRTRARASTGLATTARDLRGAIARDTGVHVPIPVLLAEVRGAGYRAIGDDAMARLGVRV